MEMGEEVANYISFGTESLEGGRAQLIQTIISLLSPSLTLTFLLYASHQPAYVRLL